MTPEERKRKIRNAGFLVAAIVALIGAIVMHTPGENLMGAMVRGAMFGLMGAGLGNLIAFFTLPPARLVCPQCQDPNVAPGGREFVSGKAQPNHCLTCGHTWVGVLFVTCVLASLIGCADKEREMQLETLMNPFFAASIESIAAKASVLQLNGDSNPTYYMETCDSLCIVSAASEITGGHPENLGSSHRRILSRVWLRGYRKELGLLGGMVKNSRMSPDHVGDLVNAGRKSMSRDEWTSLNRSFENFLDKDLWNPMRSAIERYNVQAYFCGE